jgi:hypothetical protein
LRARIDATLCGHRVRGRSRRRRRLSGRRANRVLSVRAVGAVTGGFRPPDRGSEEAAGEQVLRVRRLYRLPRPARRMKRRG